MGNYDDYVKRYAEEHEISIEEAETHALIKEVKKFYEQGDSPRKMAGWNQEV